MGRLALFHHKAATRWIRAILSAVADRGGLSHRVFGGLVAEDLAAVKAGECARYDLSSIGNVDYGVVAGLPHEFKGFHVYRDPRDFIVSAYFSHLHSHPVFADLDEHRKRLAELPQEDGILLDIDWTERQVGYLGRIARWNFRDPQIVDLRMEHLIANPLNIFTRVFEFIELDVDRDVLAEVLDANSFASLSGGRRPGDEQPDAHYRKGVPGDWRNHFTPKIERYLEERFEGLVQQLGYAASDTTGRQTYTQV